MSLPFVRKNLKSSIILGSAIVLFACGAIIGAQKDNQETDKKEERSKTNSQEQRKKQDTQRRGEPAKSPNPTPATSTTQSENHEKREAPPGNQPRFQNDRRMQQERNQAQEQQKSDFKIDSQEQRKDQGIQRRGESAKSPNRPPTRSAPQIENREKRESPSGNQPKSANSRRIQQERSQAREQEKLGSQPRQQEQRSQNRFGNQPQREQVKTQPSQNSKQKIIRYSNGKPHTIRMSDGGMVRRSVSGQVVEVRTPKGALIRHEPSGIRRVEVVRPGNKVIVATNRSHGYVQRPLILSNHSYVQRTYVSHGAVYACIYRPVIFRSVTVHIYTPVRYYRPVFYVWAYNPWPRPIVFTWGWRRALWYDFYGGYFVPYPTYTSPAFWLTDFLISATLEAAYEDRIALLATTPPPYRVTETELTPQVKQYIADEVRRQIDMERVESQNFNSLNYNSSEVPPIFADDTRHTFVVSHALLVNSGSQECNLSEGDVIQTLGVPPANSSVANASVLASKPTGCGKGSVVSIQISDLQEMQNHMRQTVERGLGDLQSRAGQSGLPGLPPNSTGTIDTPFAAEVYADDNASQELDHAEREANESEKYVLAQSDAVEGQMDAEPVMISLGQTIDQVVAVQGQPQKIVDLGRKQIYVYPDIKITFNDGLVADVQ